jgi:hypothetical protein
LLNVGAQLLLGQNPVYVSRVNVEVMVSGRRETIVDPGVDFRIPTEEELDALIRRTSS